MIFLAREPATRNQSYKKHTHYYDIFHAATDLAHHFRLQPAIRVLLSKGATPSMDDGDRKALLSLLMTASDLSDQAKDWKNAKDAAVN